MRNMNSVTAAASRDWERGGLAAAAAPPLSLNRHQLLYQTTVLIAIYLSFSLSLIDSASAVFFHHYFPTRIYDYHFYTVRCIIIYKYII